MVGGLVDCPLCQGLRKIGCPTCGGSGLLRQPEGSQTVEKPCQTCDGKGVCQCTACRGTGVKQVVPF
jgi:DnaJ-class molecular chaperone